MQQREMFLARVVEGKDPLVTRVRNERRRAWDFPGGAAAIDVTRHSAIASAKVLIEVQRLKREEIRNKCILKPLRQ